MSLNHLKTNQVPLEINRARTSHTKIITHKKNTAIFSPHKPSMEKAYYGYKSSAQAICQHVPMVNGPSIPT